MGFVSNIFHAVGSVISNVIGIGSSIGSSVSKVVSNVDISGLLSNIGGVTKDLVETAGSDLVNIVTDVGGEIKSLVGGGFTALLSGAGSILDEINNGIAAASKVEQTVISPISTLVSEISTTVRHLNDDVFAPIRNVIDTFKTTAETTLSAIHTDINQGFEGFLKLPQDLTNAFTSIDAQFSRANQELAQANRVTVKQDLVPGLTEGLGSHIDKIVTTLAGPEFPPVTEPYVMDKIALGTGVPVDEVMQTILDIVNKIENYNGMFSSIFHGVWDILRAADYILMTAKISLEPIYQKARETYPYTLMGVSEATEAFRRGIISADEWAAELGKQGLNEARQAIIFELADFLFNGRETIELYQRGIIDANAYHLLLNQNNMTDDQASAMTELMQHALSPADVASGVARGYISQGDADAMYQAAFVPQNVRDIIPELEKSLINPAKMTAMEGRATAAAAGFLTDSLNSDVPANIQTQYDRNQAEPGLAQLDWLQHWDIPAARWWVVAYFRGLRTRSELDNAFTALKIPPELWDDIIATEEELPPVWLVPDIVKTGVWTKDQAVPTLMKLGFSEANAEVLYEYGAAAAPSSGAATADNLAKVSLSNAKSAYDDGLIDKQTYIQILLDHNYSHAAAELTVELAEYAEQQANLKSIGDTLVKEVQLGQITKTQAESQLYNLGMTTLQVEKYLQEIDKVKLSTTKLPSESQIKDMWKKGVLTQEQAFETMLLIGYNALWSARIIETWR